MTQTVIQNLIQTEPPPFEKRAESRAVYRFIKKSNGDVEYAMFLNKPIVFVYGKDVSAKVDPRDRKARANARKHHPIAHRMYLNDKLKVEHYSGDVIPDSIIVKLLLKDVKPGQLVLLEWVGKSVSPIYYRAKVEIDKSIFLKKLK